MRTFWIALLCLCLPGAAGAGERQVLLATTTSVRDSGLLDALLPRFTRETGIRVQVIAVGTGAALRMGADGNADLLLTHAPEAERKILETGALRERREFMENQFVIAGPASDPAGVRDAVTAIEAFQRIRRTRARFVSRGDDSGTHKREVALWRAADLDPDATWDGFSRTGAGMGLTLQVAGERRAYVLSDLGTFLAFQERTGLVALSRPDPRLRNVYSVMLVDPAHFPGRVHEAEARALHDWWLTRETQEEIGRFGLERFGRPLFRPLLLPATAGTGGTATKVPSRPGVESGR